MMLGTMMAGSWTVYPHVRIERVACDAERDNIPTHSMFGKMFAPITLSEPQVDLVSTPSTGQESQEGDRNSAEVDQAGILMCP